jgi:hypothetical protein
MLDLASLVFQFERASDGRVNINLVRIKTVVQSSTTQ